MAVVATTRRRPSYGEPLVVKRARTGCQWTRTSRSETLAVSMGPSTTLRASMCSLLGFQIPTLSFSIFSFPRKSIRFLLRSRIESTVDRLELTLTSCIVLIIIGISINLLIRLCENEPLLRERDGITRNDYKSTYCTYNIVWCFSRNNCWTILSWYMNVRKVSYFLGNTWQNFIIIWVIFLKLWALARIQRGQNDEIYLSVFEIQWDSNK